MVSLFSVQIAFKVAIALSPFAHEDGSQVRNLLTRIGSHNENPSVKALFMVSPSHTWGTTQRERQLVFPCDLFIPNPDDSLYRGVTIRALPEIVFRWLCQMRVAPYSYDWIDNCGWQSPPELTPGLDDLVIGQDVMGIFDLVDFEVNRQITIRVKPRSHAAETFGDIAGSYVIIPGSSNSCRLLVKLIAKYPQGAKGQLMRALLPWGDLIMMRRQLLNFKHLSERDAVSCQ